MSSGSSSRVILRYASGLSLSLGELEAIKEAAHHLKNIQANIDKNVYNPFAGITLPQKLHLQAYLVFCSENSFTDESKGHTPVLDSVHIVLREDNPYRDDEKQLDYDLCMNLNKLIDSKRITLTKKIGIDDHGTPYAAEAES